MAHFKLLGSPGMQLRVWGPPTPAEASSELKGDRGQNQLPSKGTDAGDFCTMASTTVHVLAQSVVCLHCSHALVLTWLSEARQPSCSQYHEISPHPQGKLPALLKVAFNRLLKKKIIYLAASRLQDL